MSDPTSRVASPAARREGRPARATTNEDRERAIGPAGSAAQSEVSASRRLLTAAAATLCACSAPDSTKRADPNIAARNLAVVAPPPLSYCALGLAILHSRSPRFGKHFERLAKDEPRPVLAAFVGVEDAGFQPCTDEVFAVVGEHDTKPLVTGPKISLEAFDGGLWWRVGTKDLNPQLTDGGLSHYFELSGGMSGLAFVVDGGWRLCNDCKPPSWKPDDE